MRFVLCMVVFLAWWRVSAQSDKYVYRVDSINTFNKLKGKPLSNKFGQVESLKLVYEIRRNKNRLFYINSKRYRYHKTFCQSVLGYAKDGYTFNLQNYTTLSRREFYLATINHYTSGDYYTLEFSVSDIIDSTGIYTVYNKVKSSFNISDTLKLFLNTARLEKMFKGKTDIPTISASEIYGNQTYQPLNIKTSYGKLVYVDVDTIEKSNLTINDIVVINGTPLDIPPVAGVITTQFQTPLSHINVLCQNRGTPICADKNAWKNNLALNGAIVKLEVKQENVIISAASKDEYEKWRVKNLKNKKSLKLQRDVTTSGLIDCVEMNHKSTALVGGKAANFGELAKVLAKKEARAKLPEGGFAIPFYYYHQHVLNSNVQPLINELFKIEIADKESIQAQINLIQNKIKESKIDTVLLSLVNNKIRNNHSFSRMRFRSSTNAEDLDGFNGAGLYDSKTGILGDSIKSIEKAIKKVWASAWNYKAYMERAFFNIDQKNIAMGVLVHRSFPNERANGVAITTNMYRKNYPGIVLNVQLGETSIVNPPDSVTCDQFISYSGSNNNYFDPKEIVEYISFSNLNKGKPVLTVEQIVILSEELMKIKKHFYRKINSNWTNYSYDTFALDIEFKFYGAQNQLYIKQVRPFKH